MLGSMSLLCFMLVEAQAEFEPSTRVSTCIFLFDLARVLLHFRLAARFLRQTIWAVATVAHVFVANFAQLEFGVKHPVSVYFVSELDQVRRF